MMVSPKNSWTPPFLAPGPNGPSNDFQHVSQRRTIILCASDSSCLNNRRMLLLRNIGTLVSWSYIRAKTIIGIQQYQYNRPSRCGSFRRESTYDLEREFARVFAEGPAQSTCNKHRTSQLNKEQRTNSQQGTHHKQQTTNKSSNINP